MAESPEKISSPACFASCAGFSGADAASKREAAEVSTVRAACGGAGVVAAGAATTCDGNGNGMDGDDINGAGVNGNGLRFPVRNPEVGVNEPVNGNAAGPNLNG